MFKDYDELRNLQETADLLAHAEDWPELYDEAQLAKNEVPIYSAVYIEDMLVHFDLSRVCTSSNKSFLFRATFQAAKPFRRKGLWITLSHCSDCCLQVGILTAESV